MRCHCHAPAARQNCSSQDLVSIRDVDADQYEIRSHRSGPAKIVIFEVLSTLDVDHPFYSTDRPTDFLKVGQITDFDYELTCHTTLCCFHVGVGDVCARASDRLRHVGK